jgi:hypothetical protein
MGNQTYCVCSFSRYSVTFYEHECLSLAGHHAPAKPTLSVLGRHEIHVEWDIPKEPLSRITGYEVKVNGEV